ncbi:GTP-binding protein EngA [Gemmatimonas aurantiaca T-27]|uniref:GTPase Der n=1 Tax=Gemmatimonas aurantiaca (strain DSM 14586 / JCM 11422 / NBRC 100505 / T-27) TaxID=379066 RepID=DER_GEMAT|nr:ribosome biogenesis GTPase Der [Gemmatimonas aurantiaca]C1A8T3.1 RecName: Full=GTPase Der; AltName: Full=GTP-binding protein EngA [Gemmatimonas aurantiaca T-27]BAH38643.1 GTP-binding protein EngA [Gemmatimonas aurantiaca T-27]
MSLPVVAVVGRPNVGKSHLFNRVIGEATAIVSDEAGTTRDRHFGEAEWAGRQFWLVDTGGLVEDSHLLMDTAIRRQVMQAIEEADLMLFVVDAKVGVHPSDARIVDILRNSQKPWMLVANKVDDPASTDFYEFFRLGVTDVYPVSAQNGKGSGDLLDAVVANIPEVEEEERDAVRVAVIGRPNVGKSSFVNRLLGEDRLVVSDESGTTRDAIDAPMRYHDTDLVFVDTAGLRRQSRIDDGVEFYSALRTRRAIDSSDVCILMIDATEGLQNQDLKIATMAWEAGRGLILVINKWDLYEDKTDKSADKFKKEAVEKVPYLKFVPFLFTSAISGQRVTKVLDIVLSVQEQRTRRISTSEVNDALGDLLARLQPPQAAGREVKLNYATQVEIEPPTIAVFGNNPEAIPEHYVRFLHNGFRERWGFTGAPLRIILRRKNS